MAENETAWDMEEDYQMAMHGELDDDVLAEIGEFGDDPDLARFGIDPDDEDDYYEEGDFGDDEQWGDEQWDDDEEIIDPDMIGAAEAQYEKTLEIYHNEAATYLGQLFDQVERNPTMIDYSDEARDAAFHATFAERLATGQGGFHVAAEEGWGDGWHEWCTDHLPTYCQEVFGKDTPDEH